MKYREVPHGSRLLIVRYKIYYKLYHSYLRSNLINRPIRHVNVLINGDPSGLNTRLLLTRLKCFFLVFSFNYRYLRVLDYLYVKIIIDTLHSQM